MTIKQAFQNKVFKGSVVVEVQIDENLTVATMFNYITDETSTVEADITDNWVESNHTIQDHIAIKPRIYRLRGCVGEVVYQNTSEFIDNFNDFLSNHPMLQNTQSAVNAIAGLSGIVSNYTRAAINVVKQVESSYKRYNKMWRNFTNQNQFTNKQQKETYSWLVAVLQNRQPVNLKGAMFDEDSKLAPQYDKVYYIQTVSAHQTDSLYISDIEVVIKEFRIARSLTTKIDKKKYGETIISSQKTVEANNGPAKSTYTTTTPEELAAKSGGSITQGKGITIKDKIQNWAWNIKQKNAAYSQSINDFNYYSVDYRK